MTAVLFTAIGNRTDGDGRQPAGVDAAPRTINLPDSTPTTLRPRRGLGNLRSSTNRWGLTMIVESLLGVAELAGGVLTSSAAMGAMSGISQRLMAMKWATKYEQAQIDNMLANIALQRDRLRSEDERALAQLKNARDMQIQQIAANIHLQEYIRELDKWPLGVMALNILRRSDANNGNSLNVIVKLTQTSPEAAQSKAIASTRELVLEGADAGLRICESVFGTDLTLYDELHMPTQYGGQTLSSTLFGLLATVPTALVEVRLLGPMRFRISLTLWSWGLEDTPVISAPSHFNFDLWDAWQRADSSNPSEMKKLRDQAIAELSFAITSLVTQLGDSFHVLRRLGVSSNLRLPTVMKLSSGAAVSSEQLWRQIFQNYAGLYDGVGKASPALAAEGLASMALTAYDSGQTQFAEMLLAKALDHLRSGATPTGIDDHALIRSLMTQRPEAGTSAIQEALNRIRNIPLRRVAPGERASLSLEEISRIGIKSV